MDLLARIVRRFLTAGDLVHFPGADPMTANKHWVKIRNVKYFLSNDGGPLGSAEEQAEWAGDSGGARVIMGPNSGQFKYLWVMDTERKMIAMWRVSDGNEKVWERASSMQAKIVKLDKRQQMNRVDHKTFVIIQREMHRIEQEHEAALKQSIIENESDAQQEVNSLVRKYFDDEVRDDVEQSIKSVESGAIPLGFKPFGDPANRKRQMLSHVIGKVLSTKFTTSIVEEHLTSEGFDLDAVGDNQAVHWAVGDVTQECYEQYLPERAEEPEL